MIRVFNVVVPSRVLTLFVVETLLITSSYVLAAWIDPNIGDLDSFFQFDSGAVRIALVVGVLLLGFYFRDLYAQIRIQNRLALLQELCMVFGVTFVTQGIINYQSHDFTLPRKVMMLGSALALFSIFCWRLLFAALRGDAGESASLLFLGMSPTIVRLSDYLRLHPEIGLRSAGYLDDGDATSGGTDSLRRLGTISGLDHTIETIRPASIVIGRRELIKPWWADDFLELHFGGVDTDEAATVYERATGRVCAVEVRPRDVVFGSLSEPRQFEHTVHKVLSGGLAFVATVALLPVIALFALVLRMRSSQPILVRERRIGVDGIPFTMLSFRSFSADGIRSEGSVMRALPRLFNVLRGEMALVGPAPERPEFAARLEEEIPLYSRRQAVQPGIVGWEQLHRNSRSPHDAIVALEYDLYYIKNLSPSLDFAVLLQSLRKLLVGELEAI